MIAALIWDAGGTLFDTYPAVVAACRSALASFDLSASSEWLMRLFRTTTEDALRTVAATYTLDLGLLTQRYRMAYDASGPALQPPFPYAREVCTHVVESGGSNFIVTHRGRASLFELLAAHGMEHLFRDALTADDPYPRKPDPAGLLATIFRYRLDPGHCIVVGDRELDMEAGVRAGVKTCYFGTDRHATQADLEVRGLAELLDWLIAERESSR